MTSLGSYMLKSEKPYRRHLKGVVCRVSAFAWGNVRDFYRTFQLFQPDQPNVRDFYRTLSRAFHRLFIRNMNLQLFALDGRFSHRL